MVVLPVNTSVAFHIAVAAAAARAPPFELEVLEGVLMVATGEGQQHRGPA